MSPLAACVIGIFIGTGLGILVMAILSMGRDDDTDDIEHRFHK